MQTVQSDPVQYLDIMIHTTVKQEVFLKGKKFFERGKSFCSSIFVTQLP
jgi:hypothetical protein